jgi:hypothetical protein
MSVTRTWHVPRGDDLRTRPEGRRRSSCGVTLRRPPSLPPQSAGVRHGSRRRNRHTGSFPAVDPSPFGLGPGTPPRGLPRPAPSPRVSPASLSAPQMGIAGALGLATIAAPLSGVMSTRPRPWSTGPTGRHGPAPEFPARAENQGSAVRALRVVPPRLSFSARCQVPGRPQICSGHQTVSTARTRGSPRLRRGCTQDHRGQRPVGHLHTVHPVGPRRDAPGGCRGGVGKTQRRYRQRFGRNSVSPTPTGAWRSTAVSRRRNPAWPRLPAPATTVGGWLSTCAVARRSSNPCSTSGCGTTPGPTGGRTPTGRCPAAQGPPRRGTGSTTPPSRGDAPGPSHRSVRPGAPAGPAASPRAVGPVDGVPRPVTSRAAAVDPTGLSTG